MNDSYYVLIFIVFFVFITFPILFVKIFCSSTNSQRVTNPVNNIKLENSSTV